MKENPYLLMVFIVDSPKAKCVSINLVQVPKELSEYEICADGKSIYLCSVGLLKQYSFITLFKKSVCVNLLEDYNTKCISLFAPL